MPAAAYKYTADNGTVYQVTVPTDFANALGMVPAAGTEPYLDDTISPRYAWWNNATVGTRQALIGTQAGLATLPNPIIVTGVSYNLRGSQGQSIPPILSNLLLCPQGPQGPTGATGATGATGPAGPPFSGSNYSQTLSSDTAITAANTNYDVFSQLLGVGTWLITTQLTVYNGALVQVGLISGPTQYLAGAEISFGAAGYYVPVTLSALLILTGAETINTIVRNNSTGCLVKANTTNLGLASNFSAVQIG